MRSGQRILLLLAGLGLAAGGCAASGKAVVEQYQDVTENRFEGAVAVVLEDRSTNKVSDDEEKLVWGGFRRVKIMNRKALDCGEDAPNCRMQRFVCYNESWDKLDFIKARTITPEGEVFEVEEDDIRDMTFTTWALPDQDQRCYVWNAKAVTPGAILEEHYQFTSEKIVGVGGCRFQDIDPVLEVSCTIDAPADYAYKWKAKNIDVEPTEKKVGNRLIRTWTARDVPPLIPEEGMVAPDDVVAQLKVANQDIGAFSQFPHCTGIKSWEDFGKCWNEMLKAKQKLTDPVKEIATKIKETAKTETEKVRAVWKYMNENIRYVGLERGLMGWIPLSAHVVCTKKYGDCKAVAGLISVLCRELGLKADPIVIGTRPQLGKVDLDLPGPFHFNHSIARVEADGQVYWLDATHRTVALGITPARNQGVHVVVANPEKPFLDFIPVQGPETNVSESKVVFTPGSNGDMNLKVEKVLTGNMAAEYRDRSYAYTAARWKSWIEEYLASSYPQAAVIEQGYQGKEDNNASFDITLKARIPKALQPTGNGVSFEVKDPFQSGIFEDFELPKRRYALDLYYKFTRKARYEVRIPEGMKLAGLAKNIMHEDEFVKIERLAQIENDKLVARYTFVSKMLIIPPEKYDAARKSYRKALDASSFVVMFEPAGKKQASR